MPILCVCVSLIHQPGFSFIPSSTVRYLGDHFLRGTMPGVRGTMVTPIQSVLLRNIRSGGDTDKAISKRRAEVSASRCDGNAWRDPVLRTRGKTSWASAVQAALD